MSPGDGRAEAEKKAGDWLSAGARAVWVLDPKKRAGTVYRPGGAAVTLAEGDELEGGGVVPGFRCKVSEIFV